jgi:hypothetical protein
MGDWVNPLVDQLAALAGTLTGVGEGVCSDGPEAHFTAPAAEVNDQDPASSPGWTYPKVQSATAYLHHNDLRDRPGQIQIRRSPHRLEA